MILSGGEQEAQVEEIRGLSPTISIHQKTVSSNPRSTVGTITEIYDYLRLLYATVGISHCIYHPHIALTRQTSQDVIDKILSFDSSSKVAIVSPLDYDSPLSFHQLEERIVKE